MVNLNRRSFLRSAAVACAASPLISMAQISRSPFKLSVINDEISQDFDRACYVVAQVFGLSWIELRSMWGKNITELSATQLDEAQRCSPNTICA